MKVFVTVGTHEQGFERLIDEILKIAKIEPNVFFEIQYGYSVKPESLNNIESCDFMSFDEMALTMKESDVVVTHGGPSTIFDALDAGKKPIVVPRQKKFNEHVNDHQYLFTKNMQDSGVPLTLINDIKKLKKAINSAFNERHDFSYVSHNSAFVSKFETTVNNLMGGTNG